MAVISKASFEGIADRMSEQVRIVQNAVTSANASGDDYHKRVYDDSEDPAMLNALLDDANTTDGLMADAENLVEKQISPLVTALSRHVRAEGFTDMDDYLATSGIDVSQHFDDAWEYVQGGHLDATNVFYEGTIHLGSYAATSSGVGTYTDLDAMGTGTGDRTDSPMNFCATNVEVYVASGIGANDLELQLQLKTEAGSWVARSITIPGSSPVGYKDTVGNASTDFFIDFRTTGSQAAGGNSGDAVLLRSIKLRTPTL